MPLGPAHPSVVLPLTRLGLPLSPLVVGAVAPDAPVYWPVGVSYSTTHSFAGLPADLVIGLVVLWLWVVVLRDAVVDLVPPLRHRLPSRVRLDRRAWLLAPVGVAIGAATHVLWDSATHDWGFIVREYAALREEYGPIPLYRWLQHGCTVAGSLVVAAYGVQRLRGFSAAARPAAVPRPGLWWAPVPVAGVVVGLVLRDHNAGIGAALIALLVVAVGWRLASETGYRRTR